MIIYRSHCPGDNARELFHSVQARLASDACLNAHDAFQSLLIDFGEIESAVIDGDSPKCDAPTERARRYRAVSLSIAGLLLYSWRSERDALATQLLHARRAFAELEQDPPAAHLTTTIPEGFAFYALYPELYLRAAEDYFSNRQPQSATCIGVRSIGTTLSAVVAATFIECGCDVLSLTVRPRGHPFDRQLHLSPEWKEILTARNRGTFVIIDEGPGLSGSSFAAVAESLAEIGVPSHNICLFPSWRPDSSALNSERGRRCFRDHTCISADFDATLRHSGWLFGSEPQIDWSAGQWREHVCPVSESAPAVQTAHERRKYFLPENNTLAKFEGLGRYSETRKRRALRMAELGLAPAALSSATTSHGFLHLPRLEGRLCQAGICSENMLETMARYAAGLQRHFPARHPADDDETWQMLEANAREALGSQADPGLLRLGAMRQDLAKQPATDIDGRQLCHEWLQSGADYVKLDALDHYDDHFLPGVQNIAWDLAAYIEEFALAPHACDFLLDAYVRLSRDHHVRARMPYYRAAYLASRVGYAASAQRSSNSPAERRRFEHLFQKYRTALQRQLA